MLCKKRSWLLKKKLVVNKS